MRLSILAAAVTFAGTVALAQAPQGAAQAPTQPPAPAAAPKPGPAAPVRARATIKGEGITGTADFIERDAGTGRVVDVTVNGDLNVVGGCTLNGTEVRGKVKLFVGGSLTARDAQIDGDC